MQVTLLTKQIQTLRRPFKNTQKNKRHRGSNSQKNTTTEILEKKLAFADHAAISLMRENKLKAKVVSMADLGNSYKDGVGTEIIPE